MVPVYGVQPIFKLRDRYPDSEAHHSLKAEGFSNRTSRSHRLLDLSSSAMRRLHQTFMQTDRHAGHVPSPETHKSPAAEKKCCKVPISHIRQAV